MPVMPRLPTSRSATEVAAQAEYDTALLLVKRDPVERLLRRIFHFDQALRPPNRSSNQNSYRGCPCRLDRRHWCYEHFEQPAAAGAPFLMHLIRHGMCYGIQNSCSIGLHIGIASLIIAGLGPCIIRLLPVPDHKGKHDLKFMPW